MSTGLKSARRLYRLVFILNPISSYLARIGNRLLCELFALSSQLPTRVTFSLEEFSRHGASNSRLADGWGLAFYDGQDASCRQPRPAASSQWMKFILSHSYYSHCVMSHIRHATAGSVALRNTQPFSRVLKGQRHVFCHNGDLEHIQSRIKLDQFSPIGETDSEYGFCRLMDRLCTLWQGEVPTLDERIDVISEVFVELSCLGPANILYSDSEFLYAFAHQRTQDNGRMKRPECIIRSAIATAILTLYRILVYRSTTWRRTWFCLRAFRYL